MYFFESSPNFLFHTPWNFHIRFFWAIALSISITNPKSLLSNLSHPQVCDQDYEPLTNLISCGMEK